MDDAADEEDTATVKDSRACSWQLRRTATNLEEIMTAFDKSKFTFWGGYLEYDGRFVARFKYKPSNATGFRTFLIKSFSVEEYFARHD
jgi:hypothetical protein